MVNLAGSQEAALLPLPDGARHNRSVERKKARGLHRREDNNKSC
jgi:hypothetical protein